MTSALHKFPVGNWGLDDKLNPSNICKYHNFIEICSGIYLLFQFKSKTSLPREITVFDTLLQVLACPFNCIVFIMPVNFDWSAEEVTFVEKIPSV